MRFGFVQRYVHFLSRYILRPEVVEGWFYMWRVTKEQKYRDWVWDAAQAMEKHCKAEAGYSGLRNVYQVEEEFYSWILR